MGAHSLLLKAEQRETIHDNIGRTSRHLVLFGLLYVVNLEENIYCASRSFWGGDAAMARIDSKEEHHITITLACFLEAGEVRAGIADHVSCTTKLTTVKLSDTYALQP